MASFTLPTEIWLDVATYLGRHDCLSLILVSRNFHHTFLQALHSDLIIKIKLPDSAGLAGNSHVRETNDSSKFDLAGPSASLLFKRLESHATLRNGVRSVHIGHLVKPYYRIRESVPVDDSRIYDTFVGAVMGVLRALPLLQRIEFTYMNVHFKWIIYLAGHPTLRELKFRTRSPLWNVGPGDIPTGNGSQAVSSKLEVISVNNNLIPALTAGRNITTIITEDVRGGGDIPFHTMGARFGSKVMIRTLEWRNCSRLGRLLDFLIEKNPGLWHLTLDPLRATSEEGFMLYVPKIVRLKELRTLNFTALIHVPSERTLACEREHCESLRNWGCSSLVSVSFNTLISWTHHPHEETPWRPHGPGLERFRLHSSSKGKD